MPTYEYSCEACGHRFEVFQSMNDSPLKNCPKCGKHVKRLIGSGIGVISKESGFYSTDSANQSLNNTCCGRNERCEKPPCSDDGTCKR